MILASGTLLTFVEMRDAILSAGQFVHLPKAKISASLVQCIRYFADQKITAYEPEIPYPEMKMLAKAIIDGRCEKLYEPKATINYIQKKHGIFCSLCGNVEHYDWPSSYLDNASKMICPTYISISEIEWYEGQEIKYFESPPVLCDDCRRIFERCKAENTIFKKFEAAIKKPEFKERIVKHRKAWENIRFDPRHPQ